MMTCLLNAIISPVLYTITKKKSSIALISYISISSDYTSAFYMITITGLQDIVYIYNVIFYCTYVLHILFHRLHQRLLHDHSYCYPSFLLLLTSYIFLSTDYTSVLCMATVTVTPAFYCTYVLHIPFHRLHQRLLHDHSNCYPILLLYLRLIYSFPQITPVSSAWPQLLLPQLSIVLTFYVSLSTDYTSVFCMATFIVTPAFYCTFVLYIPLHRLQQHLLHGYSYCYSNLLLYLPHTYSFPQIIPASSAWSQLVFPSILLYLRLTYSIPQITPASSAWPQLLLPHPSCTQSWMLVSLPRHCTLSKRIGPLLAPYIPFFTAIPLLKNRIFCYIFIVECM